MRARRGLVRRGAALGATMALATAGAALAMGASAGAESVSEVFDEPGTHHWVVPGGVCSLTVNVWGAEGGDGAVVTANLGLPGVLADGSGLRYNGDEGSVGALNEEGTAPGDSSGGEGGYATATIPVTPGETLTLNVGEVGEDGSGPNGGEGGSSEAGDGGEGGSSNLPNAFGVRAGAGGGGGATSVARGDEHVVIAGGGGGGGGNADSNFGAEVPGGDGGGEGEDGGSSRSDVVLVFPGADGGEAGGDGGEGGDGQSVPGTFDDGEDGGHNDGGEGGDADFQGGGGGGGGATGGGGGGGAGLNSLFGGGGGGGGSGWGPDGTHFENGESDDAHIALSYDPAVDGCVEAIELKPRFTG